MEFRELFFLVFAILGGLALFIFGMQVMTDGLRRVAGTGMRQILARTAGNRLTGLALGTLLGVLIHSSGASVMLVGFVNAGLMTLVQSIPVVVGANVGTTLSMQAISFRLGDFAFLLIASGFLVRMAAPRPRTKDCGYALLGFGLLFLGMNIMSGAIEPHRELLAPLVADITADTVQGLLLGILLAAGITAIIQSSGAMIGMCFALIQAGVFTSIDQTFPIVLGAHIGTCTTALLSSIGANIQARRCAVAHLLFNLFNVLLAVAAKGFLLWLIPLTSSDLLRQTANLHTAVMLLAALPVVPAAPLLARGLVRLVRSSKPEPQPSFLDDQLLPYPERALQAGIRELQRVARICSRSLMLSAETVLFSHSRKTVLEIKLNEEVVNQVKAAMKDYLSALTHRHLSQRQAILIQHIDRCMVDLERIGDHIDSICDLSLRRQKVPDATVESEVLDLLFDLYARALKTFRAVIVSLDPDSEGIQKQAERILRLRDEYARLSMRTKATLTDKVARRVISPIAGIYFSGYIAELDRIVKHSRHIAMAERQPQFWIKRNKLDRTADWATPTPSPPSVNPHDYLERLQSEEYL